MMGKLKNIFVHVKKHYEALDLKISAGKIQIMILKEPFRKLPYELSATIAGHQPASARQALGMLPG